MLLDERALRRPDFRAGRPVVMSDGQRWTLPYPTVAGTANYPVYGPSGEFMRIMPRPIIEGELDQVVQDIVFGDPLEAEGAAMRGGVLMLMENYDLSHRQAARLVELRTDDPASVERVNAMFATAIGDRPDPKTSAVGEPPASSPTESQVSPPTSPET